MEYKRKKVSVLKFSVRLNAAGSPRDRACGLNGTVQNAALCSFAGNASCRTHHSLKACAGRYKVCIAFINAVI